MIDKSFLEKITQMSPGEVRVINDIPWCDKTLTPVVPELQAPIVVRSLTSLVRLAKDLADPVEWNVHVKDTSRVAIIAKKCDSLSRRKCLVIADIDSFLPSPELDFSGSMESIIVHLQTHFQSTLSRTQLLGSLSSVSIGVGSEIKDNGVSQEVATKSGVHLKTMTELPNPVTLTPYLTFPEVAQPERPYVLRVSKEGDRTTFKLIAPKAQDWRLKTMNDIAEYLEKNTKLTVF